MSAGLRSAACARKKWNGTYGLSETHQTIKGYRVAREVYTFNIRNTEGVVVESKPGNIDVIRDDITLDLTGTVCNFKLLSCVGKRRRALCAEGAMVTLAISCYLLQSDGNRSYKLTQLPPP